LYSICKNVTKYDATFVTMWGGGVLNPPLTPWLRHLLALWFISELSQKIDDW